MTNTDVMSGRQVTFRRGLSVLSGEGVGVAVSLGALLMIKKIVGEKRMEAVKNSAAKNIILPILNRTKSGQAEENDVKALKYANNLIDFAVILPIGIATRIGIQSKIDDGLQVPVGNKKNYLFSRVFDNTAGLAVVAGMNTVAKGPARDVTQALNSALQKMGLPQDTADSLSKYLVYVQGPNAAGMVANVAALSRLSRNVNDKANGQQDPSR